MATALTLCLFALALAGVVLVAIQSASLRRQLEEPAQVARRLPAVSILKPLCGLDDDLWPNLECFAALDYPDYEVLLGVASAADLAYPVACAAEARWPDRFRVVLQRGEAGLNPKINQLVTLSQAARHDVLVVSDSNVRVEPGYLEEIAAALEDPTVGLVTHAIRGVGAVKLGSRLDALYLATGISAGIVSAARVAGKTYVVGKSMAFHRADLAAIGGFAAFADVLAEDFAMGRAVVQELGKRVALAHRPVTNVTVDRSFRDFAKRYQRWAVLQRKGVGTPVYFCQVLLHPLLFAVAGALISPVPWSFAAAAGLWLAKLLVDAGSVEALSGEELAARDFWLFAVKDAAVLACFLAGLVTDTVDWRGHELRVLPGTAIERPAEAASAEGIAPAA
ncbi:MAG TPA: glycosyltransferase [Myxococcales bacterium]|nr:glycosyltransferase [Myxococcales bacterium]